jgi:hypothetical protein
LDDAKVVGFVFNSQDPQIAEAISILEKSLKSRNISYKGLGFSFTKNDETNPKIDHDPYSVQILKKEVNKLSIPIVKQADDFYGTKFDILFDLSLTPLFSIDYSLKRCKCDMIVGFCPIREETYDLCIKSDRNGGTELAPIQEYITQAIQYLSIIKSK